MLNKLIKQFAQNEHVLVGRGPNHPDDPNHSLKGEIENFLAEYPFLLQDQTYVAFLRQYAGASYCTPDADVLIDIFGFLGNISFHLLEDPGEVVEDGMYTFATCVYKVDSEGKSVNVYASFQFPAGNGQDFGVYRYLSSDEETLCSTEADKLFCDSFIEWLEIVINQLTLLFEPCRSVIYDKLLASST